MTLMIAEVYDALREAGASDEKARRAAEALATAYKIDRILIELRVYGSFLVTLSAGILWCVWWYYGKTG